MQETKAPGSILSPSISYVSQETWYVSLLNQSYQFICMLKDGNATSELKYCFSFFLHQLAVMITMKKIGDGGGST